MNLEDRNHIKIIEVKKELRVTGMRRSGNHAVINWIVSQIPGDKLFFNDVDIFDPLNRNCLVGFQKENKNGRYNLLIYSFEDRILNSVADDNVYPQKKAYKHLVEERLDIIIIRDPFNLFASRRKLKSQFERKTTYISGLSAPQLWVTYANEFLGETKYLKNKKIAINYNRWCSSKNYRSKIADSLGIVFTDYGFGKVTKFGGGSSFDAINYDGQASKMETRKRWEKFKYDYSYARNFRDYKILNLSEKIFELEPELKEYINKNLRIEVQKRAAIERKLRILFLPRFVNYASHQHLIRKIYKSWILPIRIKGNFG